MAAKAPSRDPILALEVERATAESVQRALALDYTLRRALHTAAELLFAGGWTVETDQAQAAALCKQALQGLNFKYAVRFLLNAIVNRFALVEIIWRFQDRLWLPVEYHPIPTHAVTLDLDERRQVQRIRVTTSKGEQTLPPQNAILYRFKPTLEQPLGESVLDYIEGILKWKQIADQALNRFVKLYGAPVYLGWYLQDATNQNAKELFKQLGNLQHAARAVLPGPKGESGYEIEILEARGSPGPASISLRILKEYKDEITAAILGGELQAIAESELTATQARIQWVLMNSTLGLYRDDLEEVITHQLLKPVIQYNLGDRTEARFRILQSKLDEEVGATLQHVGSTSKP